MATFRLQVFYTEGSANKWSNVYHLIADDINIAAAAFLTMLPSLLDLLNDSCLLNRILVSSLVNDDFVEVVHNETGDNIASGTLLPLFNSIKVLIQPDNLGRPDIKFLKGYLTEDKHSHFELASGVATAVDVAFQGMIDDMVTNATPLCSEDGSVWVSASVQPAVQMRQQHRRRRRA